MISFQTKLSLFKFSIFTSTIAPLSAIIVLSKTIDEKFQNINFTTDVLLLQLNLKNIKALDEIIPFQGILKNKAQDYSFPSFDGKWGWEGFFLNFWKNFNKHNFKNNFSRAGSNRRTNQHVYC